MIKTEFHDFPASLRKTRVYLMSQPNAGLVSISILLVLGRTQRKAAAAAFPPMSPLTEPGRP